MCVCLCIYNNLYALICGVNYVKNIRFMDYLAKKKQAEGEEYIVV